MSLRFRLFFGIFLFLTAALGFFGYTAYDASEQSNIKRETSILRDIATGLSAELAANSRQHPGAAALQSWVNAFKMPEFALIISEGEQRWSSAEARILLPKFEAFLTPGQEVGSLALDDRVLVWQTQRVTNTPYALTLVHQTGQQAARDFLRSIMPTLIFTALIVIWAAIWSALFVAALIEKLNTQKDKLEHQAMHDALTSLPNRVLMHDRLQVAMHSADRNQTELALLFIDLNRFKEINDTLGHPCGDQLLVEMSRRLEGELRKSDTVARLGGDEFAVILLQVNVDRALYVAEKLNRAMKLAVDIDGNQLFVSGSIGIAMYPLHAQDADSLTQCADVAMYAAKGSAGTYILYDVELDRRNREKLMLTNDLRFAVARGQLSLHYQPKVDLRTGAAVGAEALLRWHHPSLGFVPPDHFIPVAEQTGLIRPLTEFVLESALRDLCLLVEQGLDTTMAINLSAVSLQDPDLETMLLTSAAKAGVLPSCIVLEITETAVMDKTTHAMDVLRALDQLGFRVSMDDFGTGHSSLVNLRRLPIQELKIDRAFVMNMLSSEEDAAIVRAIVELGHSLGKKVVAEGVETLAVVQALSGLSCDIAQGYHFSRPTPFEEYRLWLVAHTQSAIPLTVDHRGMSVNH